jgi:ADP-ribose diphosphatase
MSRQPEFIRPWHPLGKKRVYDCRIFGINEQQSRSPRTGEAFDFFVIDSSDWVNIIPLTANREVVMIRQYRHGIAEFTLEVPGGMVDPEDPSPLEASRREMREETGYDTADIVRLGMIHPNPAILNNRCYTFLARNAVPVGATSFDSTEETETVLIPLDSVPDLVRREVITHALVVVAFHHLMLFEGNRP